PSRDAGVYDPSTNTWRLMPRSPGLATFLPDPVWTGREMFSWGWNNQVPDSPLASSSLTLDPATGEWHTAAATPIEFVDRSLKISPQIEWTGDRVLAWTGGVDGTGLLLAYDPSTDLWVRLAPAPIDASYASVVWAGNSLFVFPSAPEQPNLAFGPP
ncbi:MAG: hypothetical protein ABW033_01545, partial [Acidimicrobiia bacterium]